MTATLVRIADNAAGLKARKAALRSDRDTPGAYLRRCREAAGLSRDQCAEKIVSNLGYVRSTVARLQELENDMPGDYAPLVQSLKTHAVFPFDIQRFFALASATAAPSLGEMDAA